MVTALLIATELLYIISTEMGDHLHVYHLGMQPATQNNSASYPQWNQPRSSGSALRPWMVTYRSDFTWDVSQTLCSISTSGLKSPKNGTGVPSLHSSVGMARFFHPTVDITWWLVGWCLTVLSTQIRSYCIWQEAADSQSCRDSWEAACVSTNTADCRTERQRPAVDARGTGTACG